MRGRWLRLELTTFVAVALPSSAAMAAPAGDEAVVERSTTTSSAPRTPLRRYLSRPVAASPRHLDHGVLGIAAGGGVPHRYRLELQLGLLDHLTVGATAHWLPRQPHPGWSPLVAIAFYRARRIEVGARYHQTLHPPPRLDDDPETPSFEGRTHWVLAGTTVAQGVFAAGFDLGMVRARELDTLAGDDAHYVVRNRLGGGVHFRVGTRRFGLKLQALAPYFEAEAVVDVRFGLFEQRPRGTWIDF